jgi:putative FmdB family regulatory protein
MPTYGYRCEKNGHEFEVFQSISDPPLKRCRVCGSKVRRIFYPVGIVFKGPGFYKTDSRSSSGSSIASGDTGKTDAGKSDKETTEKPATVSKADSNKSKSSSGDSKTRKSA